MKTIIIAITLIIGACGFGYSDPGTWNGTHTPVNHISQMLNHDATQTTGTVSINGLANYAVQKSGFTKTTDYIGSGDIAKSIGAK